MIKGDDERAEVGRVHRDAERMAAVQAMPDQSDSRPILVDMPNAAKHDEEDELSLDDQETPRRPRRPRMTAQEFAESLHERVRDLEKQASAALASRANYEINMATRLGHVEGSLTAIDGADDVVQHVADLDRALATLRVEVIGIDGTNGKVGKLRSELVDVRRGVWGDDEKPKHGDPAVLVEARRGKRIVHALFAAALAVAGTGAYMIRDSASSSGEHRATIDALKADVHTLHEETLYLFGQLVSVVQNRPADPAPPSLLPPKKATP